MVGAMKTEPSTKRGRPKIDDDDTSIVHLRIGNKLLAKIDREWHKRQLANRSDTLRAILKEAFEGAR